MKLRRRAALTQEVSEAMAEPFFVLGRRLRISVSQGLALRDAPDVSLDELVRRADLAMYRAKRDRAVEARSYSPEIEGQACRDSEVKNGPMAAQPRPASPPLRANRQVSSSETCLIDASVPPLRPSPSSALAQASDQDLRHEQCERRELQN